MKLLDIYNKIRKIQKPTLVALIVLFGLAVAATAGTLTPSSSVAATMNTLAEVYNSIASTFDSSGISASSTGSLIQHLKYIEANMSSGVSSNSVDFDEIVNSMTLDANMTVASGGFSMDFTRTNLEWGGTASIGNSLYVNKNKGNVGIGTTSPITQFHVPGIASANYLDSESVEGQVGQVVAQGRYVYFVETNNQLQVYDISNPSDLLSVASVSVGGTTLGNIYVQGQYAYIPTNGSFKIFDISNPKNPVSIGSGSSGTPGGRIYVQGRYAYYLNSGNTRMEVWDVSDPTSPIRIGLVTTGTSPSGVYVQGRYAYVTTASGGGLEIYNVANPASPYRVGLLSISSAQNVTVQGRYAYVATLTAVQVIDVQNPALPVSTGGSVTVSSPSTIVAQGRYIYVSANSNLEVIDVSSPTAPTLVGSITSIGTGGRGVAVVGHYAFVGAVGQTLRSFDIGGGYVQALGAGSIEANTLSLRTNLNVFNDANIGGGAAIGRGLQVSGPVSFTSSVSGYSTFTFNHRGNVGVNNANPFAKLHVTGTSGTSDILKLASSSGTNMLVFNKSGNLGIGKASPSARFEITAGTTITTSNVASISATSLTTGDVFNIRVPASTSTSGRYLLVQDINGRAYASLGYGGRLALARDIRSDGATSNCTGVNTPTAGCIDYAESFPTTDPSITAGELVSVDPTNTEHVLKAARDSTVLGIVSTNPGVLLTGIGVLSGSNTKREAPLNTVPVALAGRVPVKISEENGPIVPGDHLTLSATIPGLAMKQTESGPSIGIALEPSASKSTIMVFVETGWWGSQIPSASLAQDDSFITSIFNAIIKKFADLFHIVFGEGMIQADLLCAGEVCITESQLRDILQRSRVSGTSAPTPEPTPESTPTPTPEPSSTETPTPSETPLASETPTPTPEVSATPEVTVEGAVSPEDIAPIASQ